MTKVVCARAFIHLLFVVSSQLDFGAHPTLHSLEESLCERFFLASMGKAT